MRYFAKVLSGHVVNVMVAEPEFFETFVDATPGEWIETDPNAALGQGLRKNYASIGGTYDYANDAFIPRQPYPSWILSMVTFTWEPPVPYPNDGKKYLWDEATHQWVLIQDTGLQDGSNNN